MNKDFTHCVVCSKKIRYDIYNIKKCFEVNNHSFKFYGDYVSGEIIFYDSKIFRSFFEEELYLFRYPGGALSDYFYFDIVSETNYDFEKFKTFYKLLKTSEILK